MSEEKIYQKFTEIKDILSKHGLVKIQADAKFPYLEIEKSKTVEFLEFLKNSETLRFSFFENLVVTEEKENNGVWLFYGLASVFLEARVFVGVQIKRRDEKIVSVSKIWSGAFYHEREAAEMFGLEFEGNPRRAFLLPDGWLGFPLRKRYQFPEQFLGIEHKREELKKEHFKPVLKSEIQSETS
ncbi:MAG: NADH-quinone oxidoreductase subunit C [Bacteriovoracia bacterium]